MNFNQRPGVYDAKTDNLRIDFEDALKRGIFKIENNEPHRLKKYSHVFNAPYYIILPNYITEINNKCFEFCTNLIGVSGKSVESIKQEAFKGCSILEELDLPNVKEIFNKAFFACEKLKEKYINKDNLFIINNEWLVDAREYENKVLIIPSEVKVIETKPFMFNEKTTDIIMPLKFNKASLYLGYTVETLTLPIVSGEINIDYYTNITRVIYKGNIEQFRAKFKESNMDIEPYTNEELFKRIKESSYSLKEIEQILDRKLTLDELLDLGKTIKQANNYFKGENYEL